MKRIADIYGYMAGSRDKRARLQRRCAKLERGRYASKIYMRPQIETTLHNETTETGMQEES